MALGFELSLPKKATKEGKPAIVRLTLANESRESICVNSRFLVNESGSPSEISFKVTKHGVRVPFAAVVKAATKSSRFYLLRPRELIGRAIDLTEYFDLPRSTYSIVATYQNRDDPPLGSPVANAWKGRLSSKRTTLTIK